MNLLNKILPQKIKLFIIEHRHFFKEIKKNHKKKLAILLKKTENMSLSIDDEKNWIKKLNKLTYAYPELIEVGESFANSKIEIIKDVKVKKEDIIAICVAKNDLIKIKKFILYHRSLGFDKFVILDNDSNDGSVEWLLKQKDVVLLQTKIPYTTNRREGWINRILAHYGVNRWYFVADSDEFLDYNDSEHKNIKDVIKYFEKKHVVRARAVMIDMYAQPDYYLNGKIESFYDKCIYFDANTYYINKRNHLDLVCGGPRKRIFNQDPWLTKYPLFYFQKQDIQCKSHFLFPYKNNLNTDCHLVLKHFKFQPGEINKYREIVKKGNYFNGSIQYKKYLDVMEHTNTLNFICDSTIKYENSSSLDKINVYKKIEWNNKGEMDEK